MFLKFFHLTVVVVNSYVLWYDYNYVKLPFPSEELAYLPFKGRSIFLTFWGFVLQTVYFSIALLNDVIGTNATGTKRPPLVRRLKDTIFSLAFPIAFYVAFVFWSIYTIHKELIFPEVMEKVCPSWVNHAMHTAVVPIILIELLTSKRTYPKKYVGYSLFIAFSTFYILWLHIVYFKVGTFGYPFLDFLNWPMRILFNVISTVIGLGWYVLGDKLNYLVSLKQKLHTNGVANGKTKNH